MKAFKVVRRCRDEYASCWVYYTMGCTYYAVGKVTTPGRNCGPLAVFRTLEQAKSFRDILGGDSESFPIYLCEVEEDPGCGDIGLWYGAETLPRAHLPSKTVLCKSIELLERAA